MSRRILFYLIITACIGCAHSGKLTVLHEGPPLPLEAIAVGSVDTKLVGLKSWHRYEKLRDTLKVVETTPGLDAVAPWEFHVVRQPKRPGELLNASNFVPRTQAMGLATAKIAVLYVDIQERSQGQSTRMERPGVAAVATSYSSQLTITMYLTHPSSDSVIAHLEKSVSEDRFVDAPDYDARPAVTQLLRNSVTDFLTSLVSDDVIRTVARVTPATLKFPVLESMKKVLNYSEDGPSLIQHVEGQGYTLPTLIEAQLYARFRYFEPGLSIKEYKDLMEAPEGLLIRNNTPSGLLAGDLILCVNRTPAAHTFQWQRTIRRGFVKWLKIYRNGKTMKLNMTTGSTTDHSGPEC